MLAETFSHGLIRDFVIAFGTLFNNLKINRRASSGEDAETIAVPLSYAPQQRYLERITQDLNLDRPVAMSLPRMSFELLSMNYSSERKLNTMQRYYGKRDDTSIDAIASTYSPVPYDFNFQLSIYISNIEDGTHLVEQILPYFTPEFTLSLKSVTELGINVDLPIVLNSVNMEDSYEGGFDERRIIIWTLDFTLKGQLFGPVSSSGIITKIMVNLHTSTNTAITNNYEQILTVPGQFANGDPTTERALSIAHNLISSNSDYGISQDILNVDQDPNVHGFWDFRYGPQPATVLFGPWTGNTSYGGWETYEPGDYTANGYVSLSVADSYLRHTITKTASGETANDYQESVFLQSYANTSLFEFDQFYGKNYQNVTIKFRTKETSGDTASVFAWTGVLRWLTTDSGESGWSSGTSNRYRAESNPYSVTDYDTLSEDFKTVNFDLAGKSDWENRVITALRFELFEATDNNGSMIIETDIDYIKISANTG